MTKKDRIASIIVLVCVAIGFIFAVVRALDAPVVFKDVDGNTCGCLTSDTLYPTKEACEGLNLAELHEVVKVPTCK